MATACHPDDGDSWQHHCACKYQLDVACFLIARCFLPEAGITCSFYLE